MLTPKAFAVESLCINFGLTCEKINSKNLIYRDGKYYTKYNDNPFTGIISGENQGKLVYGKREGDWLHFNEEGQLKSKGTYLNGLYHGLFEIFEDGQLVRKITFDNGKQIKCEGEC